MSDAIDLGPCCACREAGPTVRNVICLDVLSPTPGFGWGCMVCGLPPNGAVAVVCDRCMETQAEITDVCHGYPAEGLRTARAACTEPFQHDQAKHDRWEAAVQPIGRWN